MVRTHQDKPYSLCDALSFVVIERLGLSDAIASDGDFRSYGRFTTLWVEFVFGLIVDNSHGRGTSLLRLHPLSLLDAYGSKFGLALP